MSALTHIRSLIEGIWRRMARREQLAIVVMVSAAFVFTIYIGLMRPLAAISKRQRVICPMPVTAWRALSVC